MGPREARVQINASGAGLEEARADLREKVEHHERGAAEPLLDPSVTLRAYLEWWVDVELAERVVDGAIVETTRQQYANKVRFQMAAASWRHTAAGPVGHARARVDDHAGAGGRQRDPPPACAVGAPQRAQPRGPPRAGAVNAAQAVDMPKVRRRRRDEITLEAAHRLLETVRGDELEAAYVLALHIPMRVGEVIGLEWAAVDLDAALLSFRQNLVRIDGRWELHDTKSHKPRTAHSPACCRRAASTSTRPGRTALGSGSSWQPATVLDVDPAGVAHTGLRVHPP